jgi:hypothetical protein
MLAFVKHSACSQRFGPNNYYDNDSVLSERLVPVRLFPSRSLVIDVINVGGSTETLPYIAVCDWDATWRKTTSRL